MPRPTIENIASADFIQRCERSDAKALAGLRKILATITESTIVTDGNWRGTMRELADEHFTSDRTVIGDKGGFEEGDAWHVAVADLVFGGFAVVRCDHCGAPLTCRTPGDCDACNKPGCFLYDPTARDIYANTEHSGTCAAAQVEGTI